MDSDNNSKETASSNESFEINTDESKDIRFSNELHENVKTKNKSDTSESVVMDVLQDVIKASAELSDKSTETTDSEMDITIDKVDISPLGNNAELEYSHETNDSKLDYKGQQYIEEIYLEESNEKKPRKRKKSEAKEKNKKKSKKDPINVTEKHPGVFVTSDTPPQIVDLPKLAFGSKKTDIELNIALLDSLPVIEKLRSLSRTGSVKDDASMSGAQSEAGDNTSDKDSVASGMVTRNLRKKEHRKPLPKIIPKTKKSGLNTRSNKGKGRRHIFKKKPVKSKTATATPVTSDKVYFKGQYFHVGDIVSVTNIDDGDIYYAQLRGFLTDEYSDKSAVITWLLPTTASPPPNEGFHPATYIVGPEEELPRRLEIFTFVMHAPDDYFYNRRAPYRTPIRPPGTNYTSMRLGPRLRKTIDGKDIYVGMY